MVSCGCKDSFLLGWIWRNSGMCVTLKDNVIQESHDTHTHTQQKLVHSTPQSTTWTVSSDIQRAKEGTLHCILRYSGWMFWQVLETKHNKGSATINERTKLAEESIYLFNGLIQKTWIFGSYNIQTTPSLPVTKYLHYLNCWSQSWFFNC